MDLGGLVVAQDLATVACGLLNAGYFIWYWWRRKGSRGRRIGAAALALVSVSAVTGAVFSQGLFWSQQDVGSVSRLSPPLWAIVRLPLFAATAFISMLVLRRVRS